LLGVAAAGTFGVHASIGRKPASATRQHAPVPAAHPAALFGGSAPLARAPAPMPRAQSPIAGSETVPSPSHGGIRRVGDAIEIALTAMPPGRAVQMLAQATGASVDGLDVLRPDMRPITLRWRGRDAAQAWQALLADDVSFAVRCGPRTCEVWLAGTAAPPPASALVPRAASMPAALPSAPPPLPIADGQALEIAAFGQPQ
jgi:hypothetical protein